MAPRGRTLPTNRATAYQTIATSASSIGPRLRPTAGIELGRGRTATLRARLCSARWPRSARTRWPRRPDAAWQAQRGGADRVLKVPSRRTAIMPQVRATAVYRVFKRRARRWRPGRARGWRWVVVVSHHVPADSVVIRMKANGSTRTCSLAPACGARQLFARRAPLLPRAAPTAQGPDTAPVGDKEN